MRLFIQIKLSNCRFSFSHESILTNMKYDILNKGFSYKIFAIRSFTSDFVTIFNFNSLFNSQFIKTTMAGSPYRSHFAVLVHFELYAHLP